MNNNNHIKFPLSSILVIDDEKYICEGCKMALEQKKYLVDFTLTGRSGLDLLEKGSYDLLLLDIILPDLDGLEILRHVRKIKPRIKIVIMTGYVSVQNAVDAMKIGAFDYLSKPFTEAELILSIEKAIENKRLVDENYIIREKRFVMFNFRNIIGEDAKLIKIFNTIRKAAPTETTILLEGESGTGKELFANAIYAESQRANKQFVVVDCSTFSSNLLESELFGHVKGAFTGALKDKQGIFEVANGGTLFLDEISSLTLEAQGKLLRVIEYQQFKPVGANNIKKANIRIITTIRRL
ncbi:acetoacetate metabolism regulatory protein AtoC [Candidatus Magnetomorum sp. HK-1]|nr:acetoacetate metabolism regulatory protein AtoC [Candidatus Magnetomorum sp. HK-1]